MDKLSFCRVSCILPQSEIGSEGFEQTAGTRDDKGHMMLSRGRAEDEIYLTRLLSKLLPARTKTKLSFHCISTSLVL